MADPFPRGRRSRNITGALGSIERKMATIAHGNLSVDITEDTRTDEVGAMAKAVRVFKDNALAMRVLRDEQEELEQRADVVKRDMLAGLADGFEQTVKGIVASLATAAAAMQNTARSMLDSADGARQRSLAVASGA